MTLSVMVRSIVLSIVNRARLTLARFRMDARLARFRNGIQGKSESRA